MARAKWAKDYFDPGKNVKRYKASKQESPLCMWFSPGLIRKTTVIDGDILNVLISNGNWLPPQFVIPMSDGGGQGVDRATCSARHGRRRRPQASPTSAPAGPIDCDFCDEDGDGECHFSIDECDDPAGGPGKSPGEVAQDIYSLNPSTVDPARDAGLPFTPDAGRHRRRLRMGRVAGGVLERRPRSMRRPAALNLPPMLAAFGAIFVVLAGDYNGAAPTLTRAGTPCAAA
jgi:hypothetical protein